MESCILNYVSYNFVMMYLLYCIFHLLILLAWHYHTEIKQKMTITDRSNTNKLFEAVFPVSVNSTFQFYTIVLFYEYIPPGPSGLPYSSKFFLASSSVKLKAKIFISF